MLGKTVKQLLYEIDSAELTEWMAVYRIELFGEIRADYRAGVIASTLANIHRKKGAKPFSPQDFMPFLEREPEDLSAKIKRIFQELKQDGSR